MQKNDLLMQKVGTVYGKKNLKKSKPWTSFQKNLKHKKLVCQGDFFLETIASNLKHAKTKKKERFTEVRTEVSY